jgi:ribonuclease E
MPQQAAADVQGEQRADRGDRTERGERGDGRRDRNRGDRDRNRGDRSPREQAPQDGTPVELQQPLEGSIGAEVQPTREGGEGEDRRERRSRDRYGRDRRERGPREEVAASNEGAAPLQEERRPRYPTGFVSDDEPQATGEAAPTLDSAPATVATAAAPVAAPVAATAPAHPSHPGVREMPKVRPYELPVQQLLQVAEGSGLQWVNSDSEKVAAVQAAIAAEPKPVRVPRERPPMIQIDEGPLVLVETRRDLRSMQLPFEQPAPAQGQLPLQ